MKGDIYFFLSIIVYGREGLLQIRNQTGKNFKTCM